MILSIYTESKILPILKNLDNRDTETVNIQETISHSPLSIESLRTGMGRGFRGGVFVQPGKLAEKLIHTATILEIIEQTGEISLDIMYNIRADFYTIRYTALNFS